MSDFDLIPTAEKYVKGRRLKGATSNKLIDYLNNIIDHALDKPCSFIIQKNYEAIYGSGSNQAGKIFDSNSDLATLIQSCVNNMISENLGGRIHFNLTGTHTITSEIECNVDHLMFTGLSRGNPWLKFTSGMSNKSMFKFTGTENLHWLTFKHLVLDGNSQTGSVGIDISPASGGKSRTGLIFDCGVFYFDTGIRINGTNTLWGWRILYTTLENSLGYGLYIQDSNTADARIGGVRFLFNGKAGLYIASADTLRIYGCNFQQNNQEGVSISAGNYITFLDNEFMYNSVEADDTYSDVKLSGGTTYFLTNRFKGGSVGSGRPLHAIEGVNYPRAYINDNIFTTSFGGSRIVAGTYKDLFSTKNNLGWNYGAGAEGQITNMFYVKFGAWYYITPFGTTSTPTANKDYEIKGSDVILTVPPATGMSITIKDNNGNTVASGLTSLTAQYLPQGYKINFGSFTETPTVSCFVA